MTGGGVFSSRTVLWLVGIGFLAFAGALALILFGESLGGLRSPGANSYSYSALGHRAFVETLRALDVPIIVSRDRSGEKAGESALLVVAEPNREMMGREELVDMLWAPQLLLVLPKWQGQPHTLKPYWMGSVELLPESDVAAVLGAVVGAELVRPDEAVSWRPGRFKITPAIRQPQLIRTPLLRPIVAAEEGMLVAELVRSQGRVWILSDPDLIANHGLGKGRNAALATALIEALRPPGGAVVVDESSHGLARPLSLWRVFFEFPFVVATLHAALALAVLMWSATSRFGAPAASERPLGAGKATLIDNAASLLLYGGHGKEVLGRYVRATMAEVGHRLRIPRGLEEADVAVRLDRIAAARGREPRLAALHRRVQTLVLSQVAGERALLQAARDVFAWKGEMLDGPGGDSKPR